MDTYIAYEFPWTTFRCINIRLHIEETGDWFYKAYFKIECAVDFFLHTDIFLLIIAACKIMLLSDGLLTLEVWEREKERKRNKFCQFFLHHMH